MTKLMTVEPRLPVRDLNGARHFYSDVLGFTCAAEEPAADADFAILCRNQVRLQLIVADQHHPAGRMTIWLGVEDAAAEHRRLNGLATIEWGPEDFEYGCREFAVLDPDGHRIIFSSPTPT